MDLLTDRYTNTQLNNLQPSLPAHHTKALYLAAELVKGS